MKYLKYNYMMPVETILILCTCKQCMKVTVHRWNQTVNLRWRWQYSGEIRLSKTDCSNPIAFHAVVKSSITFQVVLITFYDNIPYYCASNVSKKVRRYKVTRYQRNLIIKRMAEFVVNFDLLGGLTFDEWWETIDRMEEKELKKTRHAEKTEAEIDGKGKEWSRHYKADDVGRPLFSILVHKESDWNGLKDGHQKRPKSNAA